MEQERVEIHPDIELNRFKPGYTTMPRMRPRGTKEEVQSMTAAPGLEALAPAAQGLGGWTWLVGVAVVIILLIVAIVWLVYKYNEMNQKLKVMETNNRRLGYIDMQQMQQIQQRQQMEARAKAQAQAQLQTQAQTSAQTSAQAPVTNDQLEDIKSVQQRLRNQGALPKVEIEEVQPEVEPEVEQETEQQYPDPEQEEQYHEE